MMTTCRFAGTRISSAAAYASAMTSASEGDASRFLVDDLTDIFFGLRVTSGRVHAEDQQRLTDISRMEQSCLYMVFRLDAMLYNQRQTNC